MPAYDFLSMWNDSASFSLILPVSTNSNAPETALATAEPTSPNFAVKLLMTLLMRSTPNASMIFSMAFWTRFFAFSIAVPMPCVASFACVVKLAYCP